MVPFSTSMVSNKDCSINDSQMVDGSLFVLRVRYSWQLYVCPKGIRNFKWNCPEWGDEEPLGQKNGYWKVTVKSNFTYFYREFYLLYTQFDGITVPIELHFVLSELDWGYRVNTRIWFRLLWWEFVSFEFSIFVLMGWNDGVAVGL